MKTLSLNKASTERQCLYNTAHAATWKGTVIYFNSSRQGSLNIFRILHGHRQTFALNRNSSAAQFFVLCLLLAGVAPCPEDMPGALCRGFCIVLIVTPESHVVIKKVYVAVSYEMPFQLSLTAGSPLLKLHVLFPAHGPHRKPETVISQFMCYSNNWLICFNAGTTEPKRQGGKGIHSVFKNRNQRNVSWDGWISAHVSGSIAVGLSK